MKKISDAAVNVATSAYALIQIPPKLYESARKDFACLAERHLTTRILSNRFKVNCTDLIECVQQCQSHDAKGYPTCKNLPYDQIATMMGQTVVFRTTRTYSSAPSQDHDVTAEWLLRDVECDFSALLHAAGTLEDMICNAAISLSLGGHAWIGYEKNLDGSLKLDTMRRRRNCRQALEKEYEEEGHDVGPLKWLRRHRNTFTHERYAYATVIKNAKEVVFTNDSPCYKDMDYSKPETLTGKRLLTYAERLQSEFIGWFLEQSEKRIH